MASSTHAWLMLGSTYAVSEYGHYILLRHSFECVQRVRLNSDHYILLKRATPCTVHRWGYPRLATHATPPPQLKISFSLRSELQTTKAEDMHPGEVWNCSTESSFAREGIHLQRMWEALNAINTLNKAGRTEHSSYITVSDLSDTNRPPRLGTRGRGVAAGRVVAARGAQATA